LKNLKISKNLKRNIPKLINARNIIYRTTTLNEQNKDNLISGKKSLYTSSRDNQICLNELSPNRSILYTEDKESNYTAFFIKKDDTIF